MKNKDGILEKEVKQNNYANKCSYFGCRWKN